PRPGASGVAVGPRPRVRLAHGDQAGERPGGAPDDERALRPEIDGDALDSVDHDPPAEQGAVPPGLTHRGKPLVEERRVPRGELPEDGGEDGRARDPDAERGEGGRPPRELGGPLVRTLGDVYPDAEDHRGSLARHSL